MDRNSLLAFLLIAVIIFLMPEYYKLVYPPPAGADSLIVDSEYRVKAVPPPVENQKSPPPSPDRLSEGARSFSVRTNLYTAEVSTTNGGSIRSFLLHNYALNDTESVDLIDNNNINNLMVSFRSVEGEDVSLSGGWTVDNDYDINVYDRETTVTFHRALDDKLGFSGCFNFGLVWRVTTNRAEQKR